VLIRVNPCLKNNWKMVQCRCFFLGDDNIDNRINIIKNYSLFSILAYLLLLKVASADIALPLSFYTIPLIFLFFNKEKLSFV
ncbi:MAG: hypothetical protein K8R25_18720, partial [Methanosarcinales archaeon]|nr:hypothetical protein [Methanosarcinales archaeon]